MSGGSDQEGGVVRTRSVGLLAAGLAHDLNNMLGGIVATAELLQLRGGMGREDSRDLEAIAEQAGVSLSYEGEGEAPLAMMWNTRDCHKLLTFALEQAGPEVQTALKLALFRAHFNERRNLGDRAVLLDIAASVGLHREAARAALDDPDLEARVL